MALHLSHISPIPCESSATVSPTTAQKMIAITTTATPSVMHNTTITKRPKLSLQTASLPATFGKSNTGLARSCITASPTVRNTFSNAYEIRQTLSTIDSPSSCRSADKSARYGSPFSFHSHRSDAIPYQQPLGVRSILRNSPLKKNTLPRRSVPISAGSISENRHVYFPAKKQVTFRNQLEEEIKTVRFLVRHSDIETESEHESESDAEGDSNSDSSGSQSEDQSSSGEDDGETRDRSVRKKKRKSVSSERQVRAAALRDGISDDQIAEAMSAVPGAKKRRCKWRWTIGTSPSTERDFSTEATTPLQPLLSALPTDEVKKES